MVAPPLPVSTPRAPSRPTAEAPPRAERSPAGGAPFAEWLAGIVAENAAVADEDRASPSDGALRKGVDKLAVRGAKEPEPDTGQPAAGQTINVLATPPALASVAAIPAESVSPSGGDGEPARESSGSAVAKVLALSGQVPLGVDSIPPAGSCLTPQQPAAGLPPKVTLQSLAESLAPAADTQVRMLATSTPDRDEVAFAVQMKVTPTSEEPVQGESPMKLAAAEGSRRIPIPPPQQEVPALEPSAASENRPSLSREPDPAPARAVRERHPDVAPSERIEAPAVTPAGKTIPHTAPDTPARPEMAPGSPDTTPAKPVRPQDAMESQAKAEAAKATPVRDMKFEVTGGERRVEVRLSERAGEVKMTVRTPDTQLAGTLRENLPALSARLTESGLKSEAWRPATSSTDEWRKNIETSAASASQDANSQPREQGRESPDGGGQRHPKSPQEPTPQKEKGRDFAWLMSSLR